MAQVEFGVVVVAFNAGDVIAGCLESLMAAWVPGMHVVVVDNGSTDDTVAVIRDWASGAAPYDAPPGLPFEMTPVAKPLNLPEGGPDLEPDPQARVTLIHSGANLGFAGGVNCGMAHLAANPAIGHFWVLNPDSMVPAASITALRDHLAEAGDYGLLGGRVVYLEQPEKIQIDGGTLKRWTGVTGNYNLGRPHPASTPPRPDELDFITGASMVASRAMYEAAGPMREDYFLYYEEVDWAMRRGDLPLDYCAGLVAYHWGGTAIGSPIVGRSASPFSLYFKHRGRVRFQRRFFPLGLPVGWLYSLFIAARLMLRREPLGAWTVLAASFGLPAPATVRDRLAPDAQKLAFGRADPRGGLPQGSSKAPRSG